MNWLLDHIPTACPLCHNRSIGGRLCGGCLADLDAVEQSGAGPRCLRCGLAPLTPGDPCWTCLRTPPSWARVVVAMPYDWPYDYLLTQLKSKHCLWMARTLGDLLARAVAGVACTGNVRSVHAPLGRILTPAACAPACPRNPLTTTTPIEGPAVVVPVPAARASLQRRGFNPAAEIARTVAARRRLPVWPEVVCRVRATSKQSGLRRQARLRAVAGAFEVSADLRGRHVALVDDVMTTGATAEAISQALRHAGAAAVTVWVVARRAR